MMYFKNLRAACFAAIISVALVISAGNLVFGAVEIGSLKVVAEQVVTPFVSVGEICVPAGAILQNSEVEPAVANNIAVRVDGDFAYGDLENLAAGIGDMGSVRLGPVEPGGVYYFDRGWRFEKGEEKKLEVSIFVKSGVGHNFSVSAVDIVATGETYGLQVPVYGLPIGGSVIIIGEPEPPEFSGFCGYVTDTAGNPLKATIIAIHETGAKNIVVSDEKGYYEITGLVSAMHWLFCYKQYYYIDVAREFLPAGKMVRVDFVLLKKPQPPQPPKPPQGE